MKKYILTLLITLLGLFAFSQGTDPIITPQSAANRGLKFQGAIVVDSTFNAPVRSLDSIYTNPLTPYLGRIQTNKADSLFYRHDGNEWQRMLDFKNLYTSVEVKYPDRIKLRPFRVYEKNKAFYTDRSCKDLVRDKISKMKPYYVNCETGSDSNDGLTTSTPMATVSAAYTAGGRLIYIQESLCKNNSWSVLNDTYANTDDCFIIGIGQVYVTSATNTPPVFTLQTGTTYKTTVTAAISAIDLRYKDAYGNPLRLTVKETQAEVNATPGSYYRTGSDIYLNLLDGSVPSTNVLILTRLKNASYKANAGYHYVENITFMGGGLVTGTHGVESQSGVGSTLIGMSYNCKFLYGEHSSYDANGGEGSRTQNNYISWSENCIAYGNARDGFNYQSDVTNPLHVIEINCQAFDNGLKLSSETVNGSSCHNKAEIMRINCKYYNNSGTNVIDVQGGITWNVGVLAFGSVAPSYINRYDFKVSNISADPEYAYLVGCTSLSEGSFLVDDFSGSYMYVDDTTVSTGTIIASEPGTLKYQDYPTSPAVITPLPALSAYTAASSYASQAYVDAKITQTVTNGVTTTTPSEDAVYDYGQTLLTPAASETVQGKAELATQAETNTGTDDLRIVTPLKLKTFSDAALLLKSNLSGGNTISGFQDITHTSMPGLRSSYSGVSTSSHRNVFALRGVSTGDMANGYGAEMTYQIRDNANVDNTIGSIGVERFGADNTGKMYFNAYNAGSEFKFLDGSATAATFYVPVTSTQYRISALNTAPSSSSDTGVTGEIRITSGAIYVCIATNTWVRALMTTF